MPAGRKWYCKTCTTRSGQRFVNHADRDSCHSCGCAKGRAFGGHASPGMPTGQGAGRPTPDQSGEVARLQKRVKELELEKRAAAKTTCQEEEPGKPGPIDDVIATMEKKVSSLERLAKDHPEDEHIKNLLITSKGELDALYVQRRKGKPAAQQLSSISGRIEGKRKKCEEVRDKLKEVEKEREELKKKHEELQKDLEERQKEMAQLESERKALLQQQGGSTSVEDGLDDIRKLLEGLDLPQQLATQILEAKKAKLLQEQAARQDQAEKEEADMAVDAEPQGGEDFDPFWQALREQLGEQVDQQQQEIFRKAVKHTFDQGGVAKKQRVGAAAAAPAAAGPSGS